MEQDIPSPIPGRQKDTSVLIPTANRPHFLRKALTSVAGQSAVNRIGEVIVIENGEDRRSQQVCDEFPNLPIKYLYRNPTVPPAKRTVSVLSEASLPLVALLHDDDWWFDFHLERSLAILDESPSISAVYSSWFTAESENSWLRVVRGNYTAWFGNEESINGVTRVLNFKQTLVTSILQAGLHMSSLLSRRSAIEACFPAFDDGNEFDNDRTLAVELSRQGDIFFHDLPSVVVRTHPEQHSLSPWGNNAEFFERNTRRLIQQARENAIDISSELSRRYSRPGHSLAVTLGTGENGLCAFYALATESPSQLPPELLAQYRQYARPHLLHNRDAIPSFFSRRYKQGEDIHFAAGGEGAEYYCKGWGYPEPDGTWTDGHNASIHLELETPFQAAAVLTVEADACIPVATHELRVGVFCEHKAIGEWIINSGNRKTRSLVIPASVVSQKTELTLEFRIDHPTSPAALGLSTDARLLGLLVRKISLDNRPASPWSARLQNIRQSLIPPKRALGK